MEVTPILAELTESAIDQIHQDSLEDALDSLLKAEYVIEVLLPTAKGPEGQPPGPGQIEESYVCTVYYNLACVCQKLGKLQEWAKYLEKCIQRLEIYCRKGTEFVQEINSSKLVVTGNAELPKAAQYNDLLMKYRYLTKFNLQLWAVLSQLSE